MKIPHKNFCVLPWLSIEASPTGTVRPCCLALDEIKDDQGNKFQLTSASFDDIQNSQHMTNLRREFLQGIKPSTCQRCWTEEESGRKSKRLHTLDRLKHVIDDQEWDEKSKPLIFLDLKLGNICNLKCRICGSWSSSTYATEQLQNIPKHLQKTSYHYFMLKAGAWPRESEIFWQEIDKHLDNIRYIEFTGGEPFMIQEHFDLLEKLVDRGHSNKIEIHYNTNGTIFPVKAELIWKHFRHVEIAFSIDDVGQRFEYQRSGADWNMVNGHIDLFRHMRNRAGNISLQVCTTVNIFNVMYLDEVAAWIDQQDFDFVYWNMLHDAPYFSVASLPQKAKVQIRAKLAQAKFSPSNSAEIHRIIEFMDQGHSTDGTLLRERIQLIDRRRGENLSQVSPELAASIDYNHDTI